MANLYAKLKRSVVGSAHSAEEREADRRASRVLNMPASSRDGGIGDSGRAAANERLAGGRALDTRTRRFMESRFRHDFSAVRVHADAKAAASARSVNAHAFTMGDDIVFAHGRYAPGADAGRRLLAHELAHVVQQRTASRNRIAFPLIQRQVATTQEPAKTEEPVLPSADELSERILNCIGIWETHRGHDAPKITESSFDTVAGVHASLATVEQATMEYIVTALNNHKELREKANPPLTESEVDAIEQRCKKVRTLLGAVDTASASGQTAANFIEQESDLIGDTGLSDADVETMFKAVTLKATLQTAHADLFPSKIKKGKGESKPEPPPIIQLNLPDMVEMAMPGSVPNPGVTPISTVTPKSMTQSPPVSKDRGSPTKLVNGEFLAKATDPATQPKTKAKTKPKTVQEAIAAIPIADRLGLGAGSLSGYIKDLGNWGENRAAWQRKAVETLPDDVGKRVSTIALSDKGWAIGRLVTKARVDKQLEKKNVPSEKEIVIAVARQNNAGKGAEYYEGVWATYVRLYPKPKAKVEPTTKAEKK